jgi:hypothetical protein
MGDWRRVRVVGTCGDQDKYQLQRLLGVKFEDDRWDCLCRGGGLGLPDWGGKSEFDVIGNLAERGFDEESVVEHLTKLGKECPTLACRVHVGDHNEKDNCVATVTLVAGEAKVGKPEVEQIPRVSREQFKERMLDQLTSPR